MTWQYRVMRKVVKMPDGKDQEFFGVHEVYFNQDGKTTGWTEARAEALGESMDDLRSDMCMMFKALTLPVLDYHAEPEAKL